MSRNFLLTREDKRGWEDLHGPVYEHDAEGRCSCCCWAWETPYHQLSCRLGMEMEKCKLLEDKMREIKFRAWDIRTQRMIYDFSEPVGGDELLMYIITQDEDRTMMVCPEGEGEKLPLMQFTGIHDKNGKEIYEGDIVKIESLSYGTFSAPIEYIVGRSKFGAVTWGNQAKQIVMPNRNWDREHPPCGCDGAMYEAMDVLDTHDSFERMNNRVEIIGNIYENPELLEDK